MKILNKNILFVIVAILLMFSITPAFATEVDTTLIQTEQATTTTDTNTTFGENNLNSNNPAGLPTASIEDLETRMESKMFSIVSLLQKIGKPFFIICFIISAVIMFIGLFSKSGAWKGLIGMLLSGVLYACVMYAPEIVEWIQLWTVS